MRTETILRRLIASPKSIDDLTLEEARALTLALALLEEGRKAGKLASLGLAALAAIGAMSPKQATAGDVGSGMRQGDDRSKVQATAKSGEERSGERQDFLPDDDFLFMGNQSLDLIGKTAHRDVMQIMAEAAGYSDVGSFVKVAKAQLAANMKGIKTPAEARAFERQIDSLIKFAQVSRGDKGDFAEFVKYGLDGGMKRMMAMFGLEGIVKSGGIKSAPASDDEFKVTGTNRGQQVQQIEAEITRVTNKMKALRAEGDRAGAEKLAKTLVRLGRMKEKAHKGW